MLFESFFVWDGTEPVRLEKSESSVIRAPECVWALLKEKDLYLSWVSLFKSLSSIALSAKEMPFGLESTFLVEPCLREVISVCSDGRSRFYLSSAVSFFLSMKFANAYSMTFFMSTYWRVGALILCFSWLEIHSAKTFCSIIFSTLPPPTDDSGRPIPCKNDKVF